jgi:hypothetical protein
VQGELIEVMLPFAEEDGYAGSVLALVHLRTGIANSRTSGSSDRLHSSARRAR